MAGKNTIVRSVAPKSLFESAIPALGAASDWEQGDLLVIKTNVIQKAAVEADGEFMLGVARQTVTDGKVVGPYQGTAVDAAAALVDIAGPVYGVVAKCVAKTGDAFTVGCLVYLDPATGGRGVSVSGTKAIGIYQGPALTAAAGQEVEVLIGARVEDVLQF